MTYESTITNNSNGISNSWWARCAFHYTDISNAVNIIKTGCLFSRVDATKLRMMKNDNASEQVINMTYSGANSFVRFYYRPLTPTQYHNEGYKHLNIRYCQDLNANVPVPVFFLFDLNQLLKTPGTMFSEKTLAGGGEVLKTGPEAFSNLNFQQIYKSGSMERPEEEKKYRQAEIVFPGQYNIIPSLKGIVCRNNIERNTLLNLLRNESAVLYSRYHKYIFVLEDCFENNGLYISECEYHGTTMTIVFSNTNEKKKYTNKYKTGDSKLELKANADFKWNGAKDLLSVQGCDFVIDYEKCNTITIYGLERPEKATRLEMQVFFEGSLMCYLRWQLSDADML